MLSSLRLAEACTHSFHRAKKGLRSRLDGDARDRVESVSRLVDRVASIQALESYEKRAKSGIAIYIYE